MFELRWLEYHVPIEGTNYGRREKKLQYRYRRQPDITSMEIWTPWADVPNVKEE